MVRVPLYRNDDDIFLPSGMSCGYDSTRPPPSSAISASAPRTATSARPDLRHRRSTNTHVMRRRGRFVELFEVVESVEGDADDLTGCEAFDGAVEIVARRRVVGEQQAAGLGPTPLEHCDEQPCR